MLQQTEAVVLMLRKYSDRASIVHLYTRAAGRMQYIVYGHKLRPLLNPMSQIAFTATARSSDAMPVLSDAELVYVPQHQDMARHCMHLFMAEVLEKSLTHPMADEDVFTYITQTLRSLDSTENLEGFHLRFMKQLSCKLGYGGYALDEWRDLHSMELLSVL